jgi:hypothetical protein
VNPCCSACVCCVVICVVSHLYHVAFLGIVLAILASPYMKYDTAPRVFSRIKLCQTCHDSHFF